MWWWYMSLLFSCSKIFVIGNTWMNSDSNGNSFNIQEWKLGHFYFSYSKWKTERPSIKSNKKVLLRERKRHTARRVAIAISCYSGGGGVPWQKFFFPVWTGIKPNLVSKIFTFTWGGGGVPSTKIFFPSLNMYQAKSGVKNHSLYWDPPPPQNLRPGTLPQKIWDLGPPPWKSETWDPPENLRLGTPPAPKKSESWDPPPKIWDLGPPQNLRHGTWDPPPLEMWTDWKYNLPSSFGWRAVIKANQLKSNMTSIFFSIYGMEEIIIRNPLGLNVTLKKEFTVQIVH